LVGAIWFFETRSCYIVQAGLEGGYLPASAVQELEL
jgi:hypothetical protein